MYGRKASQLLKELSTSEPGQLTSFNTDMFDQVMKECNAHHLELQSLMRKIQEEQLDVQTTRNAEHFGAVIHHLSLIRNKRCLMAYMYNRAEIIQSLRWQLGPVIPSEIQEKINYSEEEYFKNYSSALESYMSELELDLTVIAFEMALSIYLEIVLFLGMKASSIASCYFRHDIVVGFTNRYYTIAAIQIMDLITINISYYDSARFALSVSKFSCLQISMCQCYFSMFECVVCFQKFSHQVTNVYQDMVPPKDPYIKVRILDDIGDVLLSDQSPNLARHSIHFLKRTDAEQFISQGLMEELLG